MSSDVEHNRRDVMLKQQTQCLVRVQRAVQPVPRTLEDGFERNEVSNLVVDLCLLHYPFQQTMRATINGRRTR